MMRMVRRHTSLLILAIILLLPGAHYGQEDQSREDRPASPQDERENRRRREEELRRNREAYTRAVEERERLFRRAIPTVDPEERERVRAVMAVERLRSASEDMSELAEHLRRLDTISTLPTLDGEFRDEIAGRSEDALDRVGDLIDFVNEGMDPPDSDPIALPLMSYRTQMMSLASLFGDLYEPMDGLINGQTLDLRMLERARSDLHLMQTLLRAVSAAFPR
jgi:hypothetical protein